MKVTEKAYVKLNLTLEVGEKRTDGNHELTSVMTSASLFDTVTVETLPAAGITVECDRMDVPTDDSNLAVKAAAVFFAGRKAAGDNRVLGCHIRLQKQIPMEAGLGGGSSDAAAVLRALRALYAPELSEEELETLGARVGSDVPYCVRRGTALCRGRGESVTDLPTMPSCRYVIVKPREAFPTGAMYGAIDAQNPARRHTTDNLITGLAHGDLHEIAANLYNTFEAVVPESSEVWSARQQLLRSGALNAMMSGSGSAVFGIFASASQARSAYEAMQGKDWQVFLCEPV